MENTKSDEQEISAAVRLLWLKEVTPARYAYYYKQINEEEEAKEMMLADDGYNQHTI